MNSAKLKTIFDVYSYRRHPSSRESALLSPEFKFRLIKWLVENVSDRVFWAELQNNLTYVYGRPIPSSKPTGSLGQLAGSLKIDKAVAIVQFLQTQADTYWFDFIETACKSRALFPAITAVGMPANLAGEFVSTVNTFLSVDDLPYVLTAFDFHPSKRYGQSRVRISYSSYNVPEIRAYPQIIRRDSEVLHQFAIEPALTLLRDSVYAEANKEFSSALADYRRAAILQTA